MLITHTETRPLLGAVDISTESSQQPNGISVTTLRGRFIADGHGRLNRVIAHLDLATELFLEHGWQTWSAVRLATPSDVRPERGQAPRWFRAQMLADREGAGRELSGDTYLVADIGVIGALSNVHQFTRVVVASDGKLSIEWLCDDIVVAPGDVVELDAHVVMEGDPGLAFSQYAEMSAPKVRRPAVTTPHRVVLLVSLLRRHLPRHHSRKLDTGFTARRRRRPNRRWLATRDR